MEGQLDSIKAQWHFAEQTWEKSNIILVRMFYSVYNHLTIKVVFVFNHLEMSLLYVHR